MKEKSKRIKRKAKLGSIRFHHSNKNRRFNDLHAAFSLSNDNISVDVSSKFYYSIDGLQVKFNQNGRTFKRSIRKAIPVETILESQ